MPIIKQTESSFEPIPEGTHPARCISVISLGTQPSNNPAYRPSFKVVLGFEFPNETIEVNGEKNPMTTSQFVNAYLGSPSKPSKTHLFLKSWRGKPFTEKELAGFDLAKVCGAPCLINIVHEKKENKTYCNIASISPLMKGMTIAPQVHKSVVYEITQGRDAAFQSLPEWTQKMIANCEEWNAQQSPESDEPQPSDNDGANVDDVAF